jgi:aromatic-L-amino-acid/L-tryptophan decarboxylase
LPHLVDLCREQDIWLHADGAYGAAAVLCPQGRQLLQGMGDADSLTIDPHKWLFQPYEMGCVLVRDAAWLKDTYHIRPEYLNELQDLSGEVHFCDNGIQLTRGFRALKLWMSLKVFGVQAFRDAVAHGMRLAEFAESRLRASSMWEVVTPAQLGMITFCPRASAAGGQGDSLTQELVRSLLRDGYASITSTRIRQRLVLRMCIINPRTTEDDVAGTIERLEQLAGSQLASSRA